MKTFGQPLTREELKMVKGGTGQQYKWYCNYELNGPYSFETCSDTNPTIKCFTYSCYNLGETCSNFPGCT